MLEKKASKTLATFDWPLVIIVGFLSIIGVIMIFSTTSIIGLTGYNDPYYFVKKHLIFLALGGIMLFIGSQIDYKYYKKLILPGFLGTILLLILTQVPVIGVKAGGASRWLNLYFIKFQPVEILKFFIAVFLAIALANKRDKIKDFYHGLTPILIVIGIPLLLLGIQPDLGNTILILLVTFIMLYIGGADILHLVMLFAIGMLLISGSIFIHPYQVERIHSFLNPWADPLGKSYHIIQSYIAIGSGGLFGLGFGHSKLKFFYLPLHYSDFVFSIICEEGGLVFASIVICLFGALLYRGIILAQRSKDEFSFYLAFSLTLFLVIQALLNIGVVIGVFPITGIPLTFISYGGTSYVTSMFFIGVLLNISRQKK